MYLCFFSVLGCLPLPKGPQAACHAQQPAPYEQAAQLVKNLKSLMVGLNPENLGTADAKNKALGRLLLQDAQAKTDFLKDFQGFSRQIIQAKNQATVQSIQASKAREARYLQQAQAYQEERKKLLQQHSSKNTDGFLVDFIQFTQDFHQQVMPVIKGEATFPSDLLQQYRILMPKAKNHVNPQIVRIAQQTEALYQMAAQSTEND